MFSKGRTDLASESPLFSDFSLPAASGISAKHEEIEGLHVFSVDVSSEEGALRLGKPKGHYHTLFLPDSDLFEETTFFNCSSALSVLIQRLLPAPISRFILIAALGNPDITPDAVGPLAAGNILATKHLKEKNEHAFSFFNSTAVIRTGVLGATGFESAFQLRALCDHAKPDCIIAVDALAGSDTEQLCKCIQICDTGISPGSGVGNNREELNFTSLGVPVIAIGVPTVIDAAAFSDETSFHSMFVTPRDIDVLVRRVSKIIAYGVNHALHPLLNKSDIDYFLN